MASKKKTKKKVAKKVVTKKRKCAVCGKRGHNQRSHEPGGKLDPNRSQPDF
jgi:hypothetical protein